MAIKTDFPILRISKSEAVRLVKKDGKQLRFLHSSFSNSSKIVYHAIRQNPFALKYASTRLKGDTDLVMMASFKNGNAFRHATDELKRNLSLISLILSSSTNASILGHCDKHLLADEEVMYSFIQIMPQSIQYASDELPGSRLFLLRCLRINGLVYRYLPQGLMEDELLIRVAVEENYQALAFAPMTLRREATFVKHLSGIDHRTLLFCSGKLKANREFALELVRKNPLCIRMLNPKLFSDKDVVLTALRGDSTLFPFCSNELLKDPDIQSLVHGHLS